MKLTNIQLIIGGSLLFATTLLVLHLALKKPIKTADLGIVVPTWDSKTDAKIKSLHPKLRAKASSFINDVEKDLGIRLRITDGLRTIEEQNKLYAKGRTEPGSIVTNAVGGSSYHNYGLAFDCYPTKDGVVQWKPNTPEIAAIAKRYGLEWGGNWKTFKDYPHFELNLGKPNELFALYNNNKKDNEGYVLV